MMGKSNGDRRSADHHVSYDMTGLHSKQKHPHKQNGEEINKRAKPHAGPCVSRSVTL